ncbi:glycosyl hydrolase family 28 protein [uncultured Cohaesibacter sp.]|uniref:polygalacturonase PglB n=1 Tax=uncultured Cohaesibacter sp. TaxID=1002546 RepID=UPI00292F295C|nr:glycosyl hydrolase family 28 protein [uncultured Cohaesibacter sp.]
MPDKRYEFTPRDGDCTKDLQAAIDQCAGADVTLVLCAGTHFCAGLELKSNLSMHLQEGAILCMLDGYERYAKNTVGVIAEDSDRAMLVASHQKNISLSGKGIIEAHGEAYIVGALEEMGTHIPAAKRPRTLVIEHCENFSLSDITIKDSPMWTIHMVNSRTVNIEHVCVDNDRKMPNTDGIVIDACEAVSISHCSIATADDGIVLKTSAKGNSLEPVGICKAISVAHCTIESHSCALKIGTESFGDFEAINFTHCTIERSNRALGIFSRDGGNISNVNFSDISVDCHETPQGFWGSGEAITVNCLDRRKELPAGKIENITFSNITGRMQGAINLYSDSPSGIDRIFFRSVALEQVEGPYNSGRFDVRPTHFDLAPSPDAAGRANAFVKDENGEVIGLVPYPDGQPGIFGRNINGLICENVEIKRPSPLPAGWNTNVFMMAKDESPLWT